MDRFFKFDFSQVTCASFSMTMCTKLEYVNFGNANLSKVEDLNTMLGGCSSLKTVDNFFITFNVKKITDFFNGCGPLTSLDLSNLYTPFLEEMANAFKGCTSLETIELPNFNNSMITSSSEDNFNIFSDCTNLKYINF